MFKRVCLWVVKCGQWRKKWTVDSLSFLQQHKGYTESWKLRLNLCSFKWLKPILRRLRSFSPNGLFMLKTLLEFGLMKFNNCILKISKEAELRISRSSLFHSLITDEKKNNFWREVMSNLKRCFVIWVSGSVQSATAGIKLNKYRRFALNYFVEKA